jgi:hypothetical protein
MRTIRIPCTLVAVAALTLLGLVPGARAEPRPREYDVRIRYQIDAYRTEHIRQFREMVRYLESIGFDREPGPEDEEENPSVNRMEGTISAANALKILDERHVRAILLVPHGARLPAEAAPVRVELGLASFLNAQQVRQLAGQEPARPEDLASDQALLARQSTLAEQALTVLGSLGFREGGGFDTRWHTRLVGMIPVGKLDALLDDLRRTPAGQDLPAPFRSTWPLRLIEARPDVPFPVQRPVPILPARGEERIAPELRALLADEAAAAKPVHLEVILAATPGPEARAWKTNLLRAAAGVGIEGRLGPIVAVRAPAKAALALAARPDVSTVRLPVSGEARVLAVSARAGDERAALHAAGLDRLHGLGHRGQGLRVAIVDGDFRGWQGLVGKQLPAKTRLVDVTAERNRSLLPDAPAGGNALGVGTQVAAAAAVAAPEAEFTLVRVDPAAPYQVEEVARYIGGERFTPLSLDARNEELDQDRYILESRQADLAKERQALLNENIPLNLDFANHPEAYGFDRKRDKEVIDRQKAFIQARAALDADLRDYRGRFDRFYRLLNDLRSLRGTHIVANALVWGEGYPVDGSSGLSRFLDDRPFTGALWLQAAGNTRGQSWSGPFRDVDGDGVMEFAPLGTPLREGRWSPQLDFLAWEPAGKPRTAELPAKARLRVSVQWREAHDPEFFSDPADPYRPSLANLNLVLLRQIDPTGASRPRDDLEVVAQSVGLPQRLANAPTSSTYEQTIEYTVKEPGRYVLRVEGRVPDGIRPPGAPTLPVLKRSFEVRPRVFVRTVEGDGRAVLSDYTTAAGSLGMPADARAVITVGAADLQNQLEPSSAGGPPHDLDLLRKPDVLAYDTRRPGGEGGPDSTCLAAGFAAGFAASSCSAGAPRSRFLETMQVLPGGVLRAPAAVVSQGR